MSKTGYLSSRGLYSNGQDIQFMVSDKTDSQDSREVQGGSVFIEDCCRCAQEES